MSKKHIWIREGVGRYSLVREDRVPLGAVLEDPPKRALSSGRAFGTKRNILTEAEHRSFELQFGEPVEDRAHVDKIMRGRNMEFLDGTDTRYRKEMHQWKQEPPETRGPTPRAKQ